MPNERFSKFPSTGAKTGSRGPRHDSVMPIKTKKWPDIPGKTQPKTRNFGAKHMKQGAASKGV